MKGGSTQEFITGVCSDIGHDEGAVVVIKKLVHDNWLRSTEDLRKVPYDRLERWGFPLKLIDKMFDVLSSSAASKSVSFFQSYTNYTLRPAVARLFSAGGDLQSLRDDAERRQNPRLWAIKKLQRAFRRGQRKRQRLRELAAQSFMLDESDLKEVNRPSDESAAQKRLERANERIRKMVRKWKLRKEREAAAGSGSTYLAHVAELERIAAICATGPGSLVASASIRKFDGQLAECEVTEMFRTFAGKTGHAWEEVLPMAHIIVTFNWIEEVEDLVLVEDRHWEGWGIPQRLVALVKDEVEENRPKGVVSGITSWIGGLVSSE